MFPPPIDIPHDLIRVEIPYHPNAIARSATGSLLRYPPDEDIPWKYEEFAVVDEAPVEGWNDGRLADILNVEPWRELGFEGQDVKVAVFDIEWFGQAFTEDLANAKTHDCFVHPSCMMPIDPNGVHFASEKGKHGLACAQVVLDIAPLVDLHLVRVGSRTSLENAVDWAIREDIDVITMSLSFFNESFYDGTGPISTLVARLHDAGILLVTSAGNYARNHVRDPFRDRDLDGWHEFDNGSEYLSVYYRAGVHRVNFLWDEFAHCGVSDFDIYIWSPSGLLVGKGLDEQDQNSNRCLSGERMVVTTEEEGWHYIQVFRNRGGATANLDIMARGGRVYFNERDHSIVDPAASPYSFAVGAANVEQYFSGSVESFTSQGLFKPNVVGPDAISTPTYGGWGFYGTSAATPAVAGMAAVLLSAYPERSPLWAAEIIQNHAYTPVVIDDGIFLGAGYARLPDPQERGGCGSGALFLPLFLMGWKKRRGSRTDKSDTIGASD